MTHRENFSSLLAVSLAFLILHVSASFAAQATGAAPADWDRTVKAAEEEGALTIYMTQAFEPVFREAFQKKHPKIKVTTVVGRGFQLGQRIMSERRAEKYLVDFCLTGNITPVTVFYKAKILDPVKPLLALPEVVNEGLWFEGKHHYYDPENRYVFAFEGTPRSGELTYNTKLVNPNDIRSFWQLLDAKWKGKIVTIDPLIAGPINSAQIFFYKHPDLGAEFLKRLYGETNMTIVRSDEQLMDWLSTGKHALGFGARDVDKAMAQGLPINAFMPNHMKEGSSLATYNGTISYFNRAPHPNAAKLAINWLLSREGQSTWLDYNARTAGQYDSLREDISKDKVSELGRRVKDGKYLWLKTEWIEEIDTIRDLIKKAVPGK
jgi:ABC-type Fe3+ transport system substrate-binding protein